jgi:hypothetical protein
LPYVLDTLLFRVEALLARHRVVIAIVVFRIMDRIFHQALLHVIL